MWLAKMAFENGKLTPKAKATLPFLKKWRGAKEMHEKDLRSIEQVLTEMISWAPLEKAAAACAWSLRRG